MCTGCWNLNSAIILKKSNFEIVEGVYFFGASITDDVPSSKKYGKTLQNIVKKKIVNHYAPSDEVLGWAEKEWIKYTSDEKAVWNTKKLF